MPQNNGKLAEEVKARIQSKGWSQTTIAARGGPSTTSLTKITSGKGNLSPKMLAQIDAGMEWEPGRAARTLAGETTAAASDLASTSDDDLLAEVRRRMKGADHGRTPDAQKSVTVGIAADEATPTGSATTQPEPEVPTPQKPSRHRVR